MKNLQNTSLSQRIGTKLRAIRQMRALSQEQMAEILKMSVSGYAKIERGESDPTLSKIEQFSEHLGLNMNELLSFGENIIFNNQQGYSNIGFGQGYHQIINQQDKTEIELLKTAVLNLQKEVADLRTKIESKA